MLLKVGLAMILVSITLAVGVAVAVVGFRGEKTSETAAVSSVEPQADETAAEREIDPGEKLEIDDGSGKDEPREKPRPKPTTPPPEPIPDWPQPTDEERAVADEPRYFVPDPSAGMTLTIEAIGLYGVPVLSSDSLEALDASLMHVPETSLPWDEGAQRNVYIAGHYLGWPGTASRLVFYNLDKLKEGDRVVLEDGWGRIYEYRVSESFTAWPEESWVMGQELNRDMVTLQTCIPPTFEERFVVQADRV
jgi:sortase A